MSDAQRQGLPVGWATTDLECVVDILDGQRVPVNSRERARRNGGVPYYGATGQVGWIDEALFDETLVLLGEDGAPFFDKARHVAYVVNGKSWVNNHAHVLRAVPGITSSLLARQLNVVDYRQFVTGTTRWKLSQAPMRKISIRIPPAKEQERIANALDELISDLDEGVAALERARAKLKLYRASVLKAAVEGALTADWRAQHPDAEPASALLERILVERRRRWEKSQLEKFKAAGKNPSKNWKAKYKEPVAPDTTSLSELPERWCWTGLDAIFVGGLQNGAYFPGTDYGSGVRILRIDDFQNGWFRPADELRQVSADFSDATTYALSEGDLVINRVNSMTHLGKCLLVPKTLHGCLFESNMMRVRPAQLVNAQFLETYLHSGVGWQRLTRRAKWAVNQASINQHDVRLTEFPLPPLDEQNAIGDAVEDQLSVIAHLKADIDAKLKSAQALRQSILRDAFAGKLVPQDPNDEPASKLLKRIAAERDERARAAVVAKRTKTKAAKVGGNSAKQKAGKPKARAGTVKNPSSSPRRRGPSDFQR